MTDLQSQDAMVEHEADLYYSRYNNVKPIHWGPKYTGSYQALSWIICGV